MKTLLSHASIAFLTLGIALSITGCATSSGHDHSAASGHAGHGKSCCATTHCCKDDHCCDAHATAAAGADSKMSCCEAKAGSCCAKKDADCCKKG